MNVNVDLTIENVSQIKIGAMLNVGASAKIEKNIIRVEKIIFGILACIFVRMVNIYCSVDYSVIRCDEIKSVKQSNSSALSTQVPEFLST